MLRHVDALSLAAAVWLIVTTQEAVSQTIAPPAAMLITLQESWQLLKEKPGIPIAAGLIVAALLFMFLTRSKNKV
jgi:hypothetical protein